MVKDSIYEAVFLYTVCVIIIYTPEHVTYQKSFWYFIMLSLKRDYGM